MQVPPGFNTYRPEDMVYTFRRCDADRLKDLMAEIGKLDWNAESAGNLRKAIFIVAGSQNNAIQGLFGEILGPGIPQDLELSTLLQFAIKERNQALFNQVMDTLPVEEQVKLFMIPMGLAYLENKDLASDSEDKKEVILLLALLRGDGATIRALANQEKNPTLDLIDYMDPEGAREIVKKFGTTEAQKAYEDLVDRGIGSKWALKNCPLTLFRSGGTEWKERAKNALMPLLPLARELKKSGLEGPFDLDFKEIEIDWAMRHGEEDLIPVEKRPPPATSQENSHLYLHLSPSLIGLLTDRNSLTDPYDRFLVSFVSADAALEPMEDAVLLKNLDRDKNWESLLKSGTDEKVNLLLKRFPEKAEALFSATSDPVVALRIANWMEKNPSRDEKIIKIIQSCKSYQLSEILLTRKSLMAFVRDNFPGVLWEKIREDNSYNFTRIHVLVALYGHVPDENFTSLSREEKRRLNARARDNNNPKLFAIATQDSWDSAKCLFQEKDWLSYFEAVHERNPKTAWDAVHLRGLNHLSQDQIVALLPIFKQDIRNPDVIKVKEFFYQFLITNHPNLAPQFADPERPLLVYMPKLIEFPSDSSERKLIQGLINAQETDENIRLYASGVPNLLPLLAASSVEPPYYFEAPFLSSNAIVSPKLDLVFESISEEQVAAFYSENESTAFPFLVAAAVRYPRFQEILVKALQENPDEYRVRLVAERMPQVLNEVSGDRFEKAVNVSHSPEVVRWAMANRSDLLSPSHISTRLDSFETLELAYHLLSRPEEINQYELQSLELAVRWAIRSKGKDFYAKLVNNPSIFSLVREQDPLALWANINASPLSFYEKAKGFVELYGFVPDKYFNKLSLDQRAKLGEIAVMMNDPQLFALVAEGSLRVTESMFRSEDWSSYFDALQSVDPITAWEFLAQHIPKISDQKLKKIAPYAKQKSNDPTVDRHKEEIYRFLVARKSPLVSEFEDKERLLLLSMPKLREYPSPSPERQLIGALLNPNETDENIERYASQVDNLIPLIFAPTYIFPEETQTTPFHSSKLVSLPRKKLLLSHVKEEQFASYNFTAEDFPVLVHAASRFPRMQATLLESLKKKCTQANVELVASEIPEVLNGMSDDEIGKIVRASNSPAVVAWALQNRKAILPESIPDETILALLASHPDLTLLLFDQYPFQVARYLDRGFLRDPYFQYLEAFVTNRDLPELTPAIKARLDNGLKWNILLTGGDTRQIEKLKEMEIENLNPAAAVRWLQIGGKGSSKEEVSKKLRVVTFDEYLSLKQRLEIFYYAIDNFADEFIKNPFIGDSNKMAWVPDDKISIASRVAVLRAFPTEYGKFTLSETFLIELISNEEYHDLLLALLAKNRKNLSFFTKYMNDLSLAEGIAVLRKLPANTPNLTLHNPLLKELVSNEEHRDLLVTLLEQNSRVRSDMLEQFPKRVESVLDPKKLTDPRDRINFLLIRPEAFSAEQIVTDAGTLDLATRMNVPITLRDDTGAKFETSLDELFGKLIAKKTGATPERSIELTIVAEALAQVPGESFAALALDPNGYSYYQALSDYFPPGSHEIIIPLLKTTDQVTLLRGQKTLKNIGKILNCMTAEQKQSHLKTFQGAWELMIHFPSGVNRKQWAQTQFVPFIKGAGGDSQLLKPFFDAIEEAEKPAPPIAASSSYTVPQEFECLISTDYMINPVRLPSGGIYDASSIASLRVNADGYRKDPQTRALFTLEQVVPVPELKARIEAWRRENGLP